MSTLTVCICVFQQDLYNKLFSFLTKPLDKVINRKLSAAGKKLNKLQNFLRL